MNLLQFYLIAHAIYLLCALALHIWVRRATEAVDDNRRLTLRCLSAAILFSPGLFVGGHVLVPTFALAGLIYEAYLGYATFRGFAILVLIAAVPMLVAFLVLWLASSGWRSPRKS